MEEKITAFSMKLKASETKELERISKEVLGKTNKTGIVRYWINQYRLTNKN